jgi:ABC-type lipoprotein export system ATPase subunit
MSTAVLAVVDVTKTFPAVAPGEAVPILRGVDLTLEPGETLAIVGPSGSGKSTLLNLIGTLDRPTSGTIRLNGTDLASLDDAALSQVRAQDLGMIFQLHHLLPHCTVLENVLVPTLAPRKTTRREPAPERARRLLARVGLEGRLDHRPGQLSGGERQRVAVVRALINEPSLLLADEPTGALDRACADRLAELLIELNAEERVALLVITHAPELASRLARSSTLTDGRLVARSEPA